MRGSRRHQQLSSKNYGNVKITWDDHENREIANEKYSTHIRAQRHKDRMRKLGAKRIIYDG